MKDSAVISAFVLGLCLLLGLSFVGYFLGTSLIQFKQLERSVTVKGLSEREFPADIAIWPIHFSATGNDLPQLYEDLESDSKVILDFLLENGFAPSECTLSAPVITDKLAQGYEKSRIEFRYSASQTITVYSEKISKVRSTMNSLGEIGKKGVAFTGGGYQGGTEYLFTRLNEVKPSMVEEATNKAREVAQKFAQDSDSSLGKIKRARQGQFSIQNRDTNTPHIKKVRVVSTVEYYLSD
jgi:hypothetical protein